MAARKRIVIVNSTRTDDALKEMDPLGRARLAAHLRNSGSYLDIGGRSHELLPSGEVVEVPRPVVGPRDERGNPC